MFRKNMDFTEAKAQLRDVKNLMEGVAQQKQQRFDKAEGSRLSNIGLILTGRMKVDLSQDVASIQKLTASIEKVERSLDELIEAQNNLQEFRSRPIPTQGWREHMAELRRLTHEVNDRAIKYGQDGYALNTEIGERRKHVKATRWNYLRNRTKRIDNVDQQITAFSTKTKDNLIDRTKNKKWRLGDQMDHERLRIDEFERRLAAAEEKGGKAAVQEILGDGRLTASVALQALRGGEGLSPDLKNALPEDAIKTTPTELNSGSFNTVSFARLESDGPPPVSGEFVMKPLDSETRTMRVVSEMGGSRRQVGVYNKQCVAYDVATNLKTTTVGEPSFVSYRGRLHLAMPLEQGLEMSRAIRHILTKDQSNGLRVTSALYRNTAFVDACMRTQIQNTVLNHPDAHDANMKLRLYKADDLDRSQPLTEEQLASMGTSEIENLQVEIATFDFDNSLSPSTSVNVEHNDKTGANRQAFFGIPPYHTAADFKNISEYKQKLADEDYRAELRWRMPEEELVALTDRVNSIHQHFADHPEQRINSGTEDENYLSANPLDDTLEARRQAIDNQPMVKRYAGKLRNGKLHYAPYRNFAMYYLVGVTQGRADAFEVRNQLM